MRTHILLFSGEPAYDKKMNTTIVNEMVRDKRIYTLHIICVFGVRVMIIRTYIVKYEQD